jgi:NAD(P)-dependent dehydrogenase (short-subunit alcohol dehydrogenase family)
MNKRIKAIGAAVGAAALLGAGCLTIAGEAQAYPKSTYSIGGAGASVTQGVTSTLATVSFVPTFKATPPCGYGRVSGDPQGRAVRTLVNNAGIGVNVPFEAFAIDEWRSLFEVNLFGHVAVTQALLPDLIRSKGRVVNISSVGGKVAMATYGPYAATKFALEAVSDSLRRDMAPLGVAVVVVEPGAVRTEMPGRAIATAHEMASAMAPEQSQRYGPPVHAITAQTASHTTSGSGLPADAAAKVIAKAVTARKPRTRSPVWCASSPTGHSTASLPPLCVPTFRRRASTTRPPLAGRSALVAGTARSIGF